MKHALALGAILAVFGIFARRQVFSWPYYYDEADYMFAASLGWSNYTDHPSQSLVDYIQTGLRDGRDPGRRATLSVRSRAGSDVNFYRHWHGPLYFYWLSALSALHLSERATRSLSYAFPVLTALVIYFGSLWLLPVGAAFGAAILGSVLYLWSYATIFSNEIAPHQLFVLCAVSALILLMKWRASRDPRCWHGAVIATACAFCALEVAFVLVLVMIAFGDRRDPSESVLLFFATVLLLWPAAVLKLSFTKAYLFLAYLALVRKSPWGDTGVLETWKMRLLESPVEWLLIGLAAVVYFRSCDSATRKMVAPVALYGALMFAVLLRVSTQTPRYLLPYLAAFQIAAAFVLVSAVQNWRPALRAFSMAAILLALFWNTYAQLRAHPIRPAPRLAEVLARVRQERLQGQRLLAPQNDLPMIHYYCPGVILSGYVDEQERSMILAQDKFDAILYPGYPVNLKRQSSGAGHYLSQR